jgi:long-chain fatty acid transport protein
MQALRRSALSGLCTTLLLTADTAWPHGYQIDELSARRLGDAFSGGAAEAQDASTAYYNPAGLVRLQQPQRSSGLSLIDSRVRFRGSARSADPADTAGTGTGVAPVSGGPQAESSDEGLVPHLYYAHPLSRELVLGLALNLPYATHTEYPATSAVRYQGIEAELTGARLSLGLGQRLGPQWSWGGALVLQQVEGRLASALNGAGLCSAAGAPCGVAGSSTADGRIRFEGDDLGAGFLLGLLYEHNADTRAGLAYRSAIRHRLQGAAEVSVPPAAEPATSGVDPFFRSHGEGARFTLITPEAVSLSLYRRLGERFSLQGDATWTRWSRFRSLDIFTDSGFASRQPQEWEDSWRLALGGEYRSTDRLALRAGLAWDRSPVPENRRSLAFPLDDYKALSLGASYKVRPGLTLDAGLQRTHAFKTAVREGDLATTLGQLDGEARTATWSAALGLTWVP